MNFFQRNDSTLFVEECSILELAKKYGTPLYVYSKSCIEMNWNAFNDAPCTNEKLICYAVKANSNIAILNILAKLGSGFDVVSQGELARVISSNYNSRPRAAEILVNGSCASVIRLRETLSSLWSNEFLL